MPRLRRDHDPQWELLSVHELWGDEWVLVERIHRRDRRDRQERFVSGHEFTRAATSNNPHGL
jgi:hypothetical protein